MFYANIPNISTISSLKLARLKVGFYAKLLLNLKQQQNRHGYS